MLVVNDCRLLIELLWFINGGFVCCVFFSSVGFHFALLDLLDGGLGGEGREEEDEEVPDGKADDGSADAGDGPLLPRLVPVEGDGDGPDPRPNHRRDRGDAKVPLGDGRHSAAKN